MDFILPFSRRGVGVHACERLPRSTHEQVFQGQDVVIIKDSRPVVALRAIDDSDLDLAPDMTDAQVKCLWGRSETQPSLTFNSPKSAVK